MKRKVLAVLLAVTMTAAMAACSGDGTKENSGSEAKSSGEEGDSSDGSDLSIGVVMKLYDEFQNKVIDGAEAAAEEAGADITSVAPDDITDAAQQVQMIENFISQEVDILLVDPNIADSVITVLNDAVAQDIKVVLVDTDSPNFENPVTYVGTENYDAAYEGATEFASRLPEGANVVIATGAAG